MVLEGTIKMIGATKQITDKFSKRDIVITTEDKYPQDVLFQAVNQLCGALDQYVEGDKVLINFDLRGREWQSPQGEVKYFNTLQLWKIENVHEFGKLKNTNNFAEAPSESSINTKRYGLSGEAAQGFIDDSIDAENDDLPF